MCHDCYPQFYMGTHQPAGAVYSDPDWFKWGLDAPKTITVFDHTYHEASSISPGVSCENCFFHAQLAMTYRINIQKCTFTSFWGHTSYPCGLGATYGFVNGSASFNFGVQLGPDMQALNETVSIPIIKSTKMGDTLVWPEFLGVPGLDLPLLALYFSMDAYAEGSVSTSGSGHIRLGMNASADMSLGYKHYPSSDPQASEPIATWKDQYHFQPPTVFHGKDLSVSGDMKVGLAPQLSFLILDTVPLDVWIAPHVGVSFDAKLKGNMNANMCPVHADGNAHYGTFVGVDYAVGIGQIGIHLTSDTCSDGATDWKNVFKEKFWMCKFASKACKTMGAAISNAVDRDGVMECDTGEEGLELKITSGTGPIARYPTHGYAPLTPRWYIPKTICSRCSGCVNTETIIHGIMKLGGKVECAVLKPVFKLKVAQMLGVNQGHIVLINCTTSGSGTKKTTDIQYQVVEVEPSQAAAIKTRIGHADTTLGSINGHPVLSSSAAHQPSTPDSVPSDGASSVFSAKTFVISVIAAAGFVLIVGGVAAVVFYRRGHLRSESPAFPPPAIESDISADPNAPHHPATMPQPHVAAEIVI